MNSMSNVHNLGRNLQQTIDLLVALNEEEATMQAWEILDALRPYADAEAVDQIVNRQHKAFPKAKFKPQQKIFVKDGSKVWYFPNTNVVHSEAIASDREAVVVHSWWVDLRDSLWADPTEDDYVGLAYELILLRDCQIEAEHVMVYEPSLMPRNTSCG